jgi:hypothetical protein
MPVPHGVGAELPLAHQLFSVQMLHSVCLGTFVYLPASHSVHEPWPPSASYEPGGHSVLLVLPVGA